MKKLLGLLAIVGLLIVAGPTQRAQALSLLNPSVAAAVAQEGVASTTDVRWRRYGYRRYYVRRYYHRRYYRLY